MGEFSKTINNGAEDISVKDRFFALEHHTQAFQAQAGIDILPRQRCASAVEVLVELHEDQVPDLKVAFAFAAWFTISPATAMLGTAIKVDLGIRRSEEHTSELQSRLHLVCRLLLEKKTTHELVHAHDHRYHRDHAERHRRDAATIDRHAHVRAYTRQPIIADSQAERYVNHEQHPAT